MGFFGGDWLDDAFSWGGSSRGSSENRSNEYQDWLMGTYAAWADELKADPSLAKYFEQAMKFQEFDPRTFDYMGMARTGAKRVADTQAQSLQNALAARGGGSLASAVGIGSQGRVGAELAGMSAGAGLEQSQAQLLAGIAAQKTGMLENYVRTKYGLLGSIFAPLASLGGAMRGAESREYAAEAGAWSNLFSSIIGAGGKG